MKDLRVLVLDSAIPGISYDELRPFFDVIVAVGVDAGKFCSSPDIMISMRTDPHVNGFFDLSIYEKYRKSILCITQSELNTIKRMARYHSSYVLAWQPAHTLACCEFGTDSAIPYCLSSADPGVHLAQASGATDIYARSVQGGDFHLAIDILIKEKSGYVPTNILRPVRPQFLDEVRFSQ